MYWGIDGCKTGWIAIGLDDGDSYQYGVFAAMQDFWIAHQPTIKKVLIDIPIGLPDDELRNVESLARKLIKSRSSSFFPVPTRAALDYAAAQNFSPDAYATACDINQQAIGRRFSKQTWNIMPKIYDIDRFLQDTQSAQEMVFEAHPELLFWSLNGEQPLSYSKKMGLGFHERVEILQRYQSNALDIIRDVYDAHRKVLVDDDVVDALACAIAARMDKLQSLPASPAYDSVGLPMQMMYPKR